MVIRLFLQRKRIKLNSLQSIYYNMSKTIINTPNAPAPIGPYNQAVGTGNLLFISGQVCIDPATGDLKNGSIEEETT
jgi:enamine deaminase RidA (YjgF/YER057c/UK114 family)